ncbi:alpha-glucosidase [Fulvimonas soli]|jgi:alpha-glucosidase|uniref:Alpha-amylase n=1 Tax=Fulvimonas soli TaxID=155197 RepID=A0A316I5V3_9GAMM|nr:alpha-glucosidase [Fulvimonas soli]PWK87763.1 alpha-glucosidase [Fulvimonas soli]TNY26524.1 glucohydrolase [Fulvimonas soli]
MPPFVRRLALGFALSLAVAGAHAATDPWWKHAVIYEIYPRSFGDSNGDGVGDLRGIAQHLDYLQKLGVDAIWIAPMYPSPQVDFGYDIADYEAVDPQYGSLADFDALLREAGRRHVRVILDMVLNHTSDRHPWFVESARSRDNPKADWYVWNDGVDADAPGVTPFQKRFEHDGKVPPNNWESVFGGSAWEWVPARRQFYYHRFYRQQPDLNWRNPAVEQAMFGAMRFWLDRGVAGFRLDAISTLFEDPALRNDPQRPGTNAQGDPNLHSLHSDNLPEVHEVIRRMRAMVDSYPGERVLIGETYTPDVAELDKWYGGARRDELHLPMNTLPGFGAQARFDAGWFRKALEDAQDVHGQPLIVFDNHDNPRSIDRFGDGRHDVQRAKAIATLLLTTRAAALTYYGAPLGMTTATPTRKEDVRDPIGITGWPKEKGRDGERTPMQWTPGPQAGFSTSPRTWLPVNPNHVTVNVQTELAEPGSLLNWYRTLIALRRANPALRDGAMTFLDRADPDVLVYRREGAEPVTVLVNFSGGPRRVGAGLVQGAVRTLAATDPALARATTLDGATLPPYASWVVAPKH